MKRYYIILTIALLLAVLITPTVLGHQVQSDEVADTGSSIPMTADTGANSINPAIISAASSLPNSLIFGNQAMGTTSAVQTTTLQNTDAAPLTITNIAISSHYTQTNDCPITPNPLAVSATCVFSVTFAPTSVGIITGTLIITSDTGSSPDTVVLTGTGTNYQVFLPIIIKAPYEPAKGISLAYPNCEDLGTLGAGWYMNFSNVPSAGCPFPDQRFVPMVYNADLATGLPLTTAINNAQASGWLLGFGEPNLPWNGNTTPLEGAMAWRAIEAAALPVGIKLVAPGPSQHNPGYFDPLGYTWIWAMVDVYQTQYGEKPHFDAMAWNYYESNPQATINFLTARRNEALARGYDVPFWLLEYAGRCWDTGNFPTGNQAIMTQVTPWAKSTPWIARFAWFSNRISSNEPWDGGNDNSSCSLLNPNTGDLTQLGAVYAGY